MDVCSKPCVHDKYDLLPETCLGDPGRDMARGDGENLIWNRRTLRRLHARNRPSSEPIGVVNVHPGAVDLRVLLIRAHRWHKIMHTFHGTGV